MNIIHSVNKHIIEMGLLWRGKTYLKNVGQKAAAKLLNFEDDLIVQDSNLGRLRLVQPWSRGKISLRSPTLTVCSFAAL